MIILIENGQEKLPVTSHLETLIRNVAAASLKAAAPHLGDSVEVAITLVDNEEIAGLNEEHRAKAGPTDVLSFPQLEGEEIADPPVEAGQPLLLGDIVISLERAQEQAVDYGHSLEREVGFLVAHGMLHLLGYDHQTPEDEAAMNEQTEAVLTALGLLR